MKDNGKKNVVQRKILIQQRYKRKKITGGKHLQPKNICRGAQKIPEGDSALNPTGDSE